MLAVLTVVCAAMLVWVVCGLSVQSGSTLHVMHTGIDSIEQPGLRVLPPGQPPLHHHHRHQPNTLNIPQISLVYFQTTAQINPTQFCELSNWAGVGQTSQTRPGPAEWNNLNIQPEQSLGRRDGSLLPLPISIGPNFQTKKTLLLFF